ASSAASRRRRPTLCAPTSRHYDRVMGFSVDIWLRGDHHATTVPLDVTRQPGAWTDDDVREVLEGMLRAMDRLKRPGETDRAVALRGISWIVNPYENGVVIAIEISLGAAVAGP